jgi:hypothetical protein
VGQEVRERRGSGVVTGNIKAFNKSPGAEVAIAVIRVIKNRACVRCKKPGHREVLRGDRVSVVGNSLYTPTRRRGGSASQAEPGTSAKGRLADGTFCTYKYQLATQVDSQQDSCSHLFYVYLSAARNRREVAMPARVENTSQWNTLTRQLPRSALQPFLPTASRKSSLR